MICKKIDFIVGIDSKELQVTLQFTKSRAAEGQIIYTDCLGAGGTDHRLNNSRFKRSICINCEKLGYIQRVCRSIGQN